MEAKINIAKILKDKPVNTKLYSPLYGDVYFSYIGVRNNIIVLHHRFTLSDFLYNGRYTAYKESEIMLFPSKEMRDWRKFAWKKGDVLVCTDGKAEVIFERFDDDNYTSFVGKHYLESYGKDGDLLDYEQEHFGNTANYTKESDETVQCYINTIEERLGGKLNRKTLEVEKAQTEFKDGDFVCYTSLDGDKCIGIVKETKNDAIVLHVDYNLWTHSMDFNVSISKENFEFYKSNDLDDEIALNEALYIRYKSWNKEKNILEELKPKVDLKPFDKVLVRDSKSDNWRANLFGYIGKDGYYRCVYANWIYCIPYAGNEHLLGTTKDVEG